MRLWSCHKPDWDLTTGFVDPEKSEYCSVYPNYLPVCRELKLHLNTDQIIWCVVHPKDRGNSYSKIEWELNVPESEILVFIDSVIWCRIIGEKNFQIPSSVYEQIKKQVSSELLPSQFKNKREFRNHLEEEYRNLPEPECGWWSKLYLTDPENECAHAIVPHPAKLDWVIYKNGQSWQPSGMS